MELIGLETHRYCRKRPEVRHQPGVRVGTQARMLARSSCRKFSRCCSVEAPLHVGPRIHARLQRGPGNKRSRPVDRRSCARKKWLSPTPWSVVPKTRTWRYGRQCSGSYLLARTTIAMAFQRMKALDAPLDRAVPGVVDFLLRRDRVHVGRIQFQGSGDTEVRGAVQKPLQKVRSPVGPPASIFRRGRRATRASLLDSGLPVHLL